MCAKGLAKDGTNHKILAFNAGNSAYSLGNYMRADSCYAIAIRIDENYAPAYLNRANAQLKLDHLEDSKNNYIKYLELDAESEQREKIELLIQKLEEEIALRAKQKPELINPDDFIEGEKMEVPEIPEKVEDFDGKAPDADKSEDDKIEIQNVSMEDVLAPTLPSEQKSYDGGVKVVGESLPPLLQETYQTKKEDGLPENDASLKTEDNSSEKIDEKSLESELPQEKKIVRPVKKAQEAEKVEDGAFVEEAKIEREVPPEKIQENVEIPDYKARDGFNDKNLEKVFDDADDVGDSFQ